jgi:hypothetical protein
VLLLFEAISLLALLRDLSEQRTDFLIAIVVGLISSSLPYGYLVGLLTGVVCVHLSRRGLTRLGAGR